MSDQDKTREEQIREIAKKTVRYHLPAEATVTVRGASYTTAEGDVAMDVYYPSQPRPADRLPVVVVVFGYPDPDAGIRQFGPATSWAKLIAASGMAAVVYGTRQPADDVHAILRDLRANAAALNIDERRVGLFSTSGSVPVALSALMRDATLRCGALLYGCTMDFDGSTAVADMSKQVGFVNACAGKSAADLPDGVPLLFVRAGRDQFPGLNDALDRVVSAALARNLPLTLVNYATGLHGFDCDEDTVVSRGVIQQVLAFLRLHVEA